MAKRGTTQPLKIGVFDDWLLRPEILALRDMGHEVLNLDSINQYDVDLILHPAAHLWNDMMWDYLPAAIAAARKRKRESK